MRPVIWAICPGCGRYATDGFCGTCVAEWRTIENACRRCGLPLPGLGARCMSCDRDWAVDRVVSPFEYCTPLDHYLKAFKYGRQRALGRAFALLLAERIFADRGSLDALVAVPLHPARLRSRGFNQALEIARALSRPLGLPVLQRGIARHEAAPSQTSVGATARRTNVASAFEVARCLRGLRLMIVDDVVTTGATVNALAEALMSAGAASCAVGAIARVRSDAHARKV